MDDKMPAAGQARRLSRRGLLLGGLAVGTLAAVGGGLVAANANDKPLALVYNGPQGCDDCAPTIAAVLRGSPAGYRTRYVGPGTGTPLTASVLAQASLYVQPGGGSDLQATWKDLAPVADDMRSWVADGGSYMGMCFGAYLAGRDPGFGLLPGDAFGWAGSDGASVPDDRDTVIPVRWRGHRRHVYFQDGPGFRIDDEEKTTVLATYDDGVPAVLVARYGKGRVGVTGPHPEASRTWFMNAGLENPDGYSQELADDLIATTMRR